MKDMLVRATTEDGLIRAAAISATRMVEEARLRHNTAPTATAALGRALIATVFLGLNLKGEDTLTLRIMGDGPLGAIITQADGEYRVRGYVQEPSCHLPPTKEGKLDVGQAVGHQGMLYVTRDLGLKEPYTGTSPLVTGEIGDDVANYLYQSEQAPAVVALGVLVDRDWSCLAAGGFFVQALPGAKQEMMKTLEERVREISSVTSLLRQGLGPEELLRMVFGPVPLEILEKSSCSFACRCNRDRLQDLLIAMGEEEIRDMMEKDQGAELRCHFCNKIYRFDSSELAELLERIKEKSG